MGVELSRREVLRSGMFAGIGMFFTSALGGSGAFLWPVKVTGFGSTVVVPIKPGDIKVGDVIPVREGKCYLTRSEDGLMALYWRCVHLGCTVPWNAEAGKFICPCHQSTYLITGQNVAGPATRPLDYMDLHVEGEQVVIETGKIHTRTRHQPGQAVKV
ncbi:MAG TPA: Rieske 2Fe-2S domain-containing protein [Symbiobacteriaceae bacterium]|jgi:cytochrome b6-f complex iron-sulfur subunit